MSKESLQGFYVAIQDDASAIEQLKSADSKEALSQMAVELGAEKGFSFTTEEVLSAISALEKANEEELSDSELELVAGGKGGGSRPTAVTSWNWGSLGKGNCLTFI